MSHAAYSRLGRTKVLYATSLVLLGAKAKFLRRKPRVFVVFKNTIKKIKSKPIFVLHTIKQVLEFWYFL